MDIALSRDPLSAWRIRPGELPVIAGPCSAESRDQLMRTASGLAACKIHVLRAGIWKPRTRPGAFEGMGTQALAWLKDAGRSIGKPVTVEVASAEHVRDALEHEIDMLWIGARTTANPIVVTSIAEALRGVDIPVMVKNPINPDIGLWLGALERFANAGICRLAAIHRGFSTENTGKYRNEPIWRIPLELKRRLPALPLICDPSHITGSADLLLAVAQNALDLLFDGLMIETHCDPSAALSDAQQQITPAQLSALLGRLARRDPSNGSDEYRAQVSSLRHELDEIDDSLIRLLASRMATARKIARVQKRNNVAMYQPDRWKETLRNRSREGEEQGLDRTFMMQLYELIHEEALRQKEDAK
jgi:chorismate mutase